jgi:hypothetical protein
MIEHRQRVGGSDGVALRPFALGNRGADHAGLESAAAQQNEIRKQTHAGQRVTERTGFSFRRSAIPLSDTFVKLRSTSRKNGNFVR